MNEKLSVVGLAEESKIPDTVTTCLPQRWRQASLVTAHLFQEVQEAWLVWTPQEIPVKKNDSIKQYFKPSYLCSLRFTVQSVPIFRRNDL